MTRRILVPYDGSPLSERALEHALENYPAASVTTLYVIDPVDSVYDVESGGLPVAEDWYEDAQERASEIHAAAEQLASPRDVALTAVTVTGNPAREIREYASEHDVDQIVMGSHGRKGIDRALLGSVAETVTRRARVPVTVVK